MTARKEGARRIRRGVTGVLRALEIYRMLKEMDREARSVFESPLDRRPARSSKVSVRAANRVVPSSMRAQRGGFKRGRPIEKGSDIW